MRATPEQTWLLRRMSDNAEIEVHYKLAQEYKSVAGFEVLGPKFPEKAAPVGNAGDFGCAMCTKNFANKGELTAHMMSHTKNG